MDKSRALIITGMHRSGTSLVANLLRHTGVHLGEELIGPDEGNRYGYFEDVDFNTFHGDVLNRFQQSYLVQDAAVLGDIKPEEKERARELIERRSTWNLWGFKDPRACLFLKFWHGLLPQAAYVFVYRHPLEVVLSLLRRGKEFDVDALADPLAALRSWETHNRLLLDFCIQHADSCFLGHIKAISADTGRFLDRASRKLAVPLQAKGTQTLYHPTALNQMFLSAETILVLNKIAPEAMRLYRRLNDRADLPSRARTRVARRPVSHSRKLKVASKLVRDDAPQGDQTSHLFSLLLTAVEPQEVLAGKEALDGIRRNRISTLQTEAASRERLVAAQKQELGRVGDHARNLELRAAAHEERLAGLTAYAEHLKKLAESQQEQLQAASVQAQKLSDVVAGQEEQLRGLTACITELRRMLTGKDAQVEEQTARNLELQGMLAGKDAQVQEQTARNLELQGMLAGKDAQVQEQTARNLELQGMLASKAEQLQETVSYAVELEKTLADNEEQLAETMAHAGKLETLLESKEQHLQHLTAHAAELERVLASQQAQTQNLQDKLNMIEASRVWRLAQKWYAFKFILGFRPKPRRVEAPAGEEIVASQAPAIEASSSVQEGGRPNGTPKVLFISHDARPHGAQILLLHFLKWFKANSQIPFEVLLKEDGLLRPDFEALAPVAVWNGRSPDRLETQLKQANIGLIYSNTITNGSVIDSLSSLNCPVICHVHELEYCLNYQTDRDNNKQIKRLASHYIAVSRAVQQSLVQNLKIRENQIDVVYEFIPTHLGPSQSRARDRIRSKLKIPPDASVVGACGTTDWRKGPDLFIQLARLVHQRQTGKPVHFVWVGGQSEGPHFATLWHDVKHMNMEDYVHFTGAVRNPLEYFSTFDVFCLTSREDPYPLVNLEVASLGTPIVCFDDSGGAKEFVEDDCGFVVPYLDLETMADRVSDLLGCPELRQRLGQRAAAKVRERHDLEDTAPQILRIIESFLSPGRNAQQLLK